MQNKNIIKQLPILRIAESSKQNVNDSVVVEKAFMLQVNDSIELKILCTPCDIREMVVGLLFSENMIKSPQDIISLDFQDTLIKANVKQQTNINKKTIIYGCYQTYTYILPNKNHLDKVYVKKIINIINVLKKGQKVFAETGATHAAMLFNQDGEGLFFAEDIGRHNGIDKVIGKCLLEHGTVLPGCGIALSSRVSFELISKIARAGIELIAAVSAPSSLAIEAADYWQITLCGFVRNGKINVYTHPQRISFVAQ